MPIKITKPLGASNKNQTPGCTTPASPVQSPPDVHSGITSPIPFIDRLCVVVKVPEVEDAYTIHSNIWSMTQTATATGTKELTKAEGLADLLRRYFASPDFLNLADQTQRNYRRILERFSANREDRRVADLQRSHMKVIIGQMADRPEAANSLLKRVKTLLGFAADIGMIPSNPLVGMRGVKNSSDGFHTWTDEEVAEYEERHPIGSKGRLAMALMLYTGQRKSDIVRLGWQHVKGQRITVRQEKTGATVDIPIHPELRRVLEGTPRQNLTFLMTEHGKPFTANGFGNWMRDRCDEAGLPQCSSHGLRKAMAKRLAEAGCTVNEIMAVTGHATEGEVIRYTKEARKRLLADNAMDALQGKRKTTIC